MIIGIGGKAGAGKDTLAKFLVYFIAIRKGYQFGSNNPLYYGFDYVEDLAGVKVLRFATGVKRIASMFTGIPEDAFNDQHVKDSVLDDRWNGMTVRELLQRIGTDCIRNHLHKDAWVNLLMAQIQRDSFNSSRHVDHVITDVRFPNEAKAIKDAGGYLICVKRPNLPEMDHPSETALDDWKDWDFVVDNDRGFDKLHHVASEIIYEILGDVE